MASTTPFIAGRTPVGVEDLRMKGRRQSRPNEHRVSQFPHLAAVNKLSIADWKAVT